MKRLTTLTLLLFSVTIFGQDLAHVQNVDEPNSISQEQIILSGYTWLTNTENIQACNTKKTSDISIEPIGSSKTPSNDFMQIDHFQHNNSLMINVNLLDEASLQLKDSNGHVVFNSKLKEGRQQQTIYLDAYESKHFIISLITPTEVVNKEVRF